MNISNIRELLESPNTFTCVIHGILMKQYGEDYLYWSPTTVWLELKDDFGVELNTISVDKYSAAQVIMTGNSFFSRIDGFHNIANTLATGVPNFTLFDPVTPEEAVWAIAEVAIMRDMLEPVPSLKDYVETVFTYNKYNIHPIAKIFISAENNDYRDLILDEIIRCLLYPTNNIDLFVGEQMKDINYQAFSVSGLANFVLPDKFLVKNANYS